MKTPYKKTGELSGNRRRQISPALMRGVSGCFVCGRDHRASDKHKSEEVTAAVKRLMEKVPKAFLTVEYLDLVVDMRMKSDEPDMEEDGGYNDKVQWAEQDYEVTQYIFHIRENEAADQDVKKRFAISSFIPGSAY